MDAIDYKILRCLKENSRQKASQISAQINLSVSAVIERIHKMETAGYIKQYTAILDSKMMGNDIVALMEVSLEHPKYYDSFTNAVLHNPNIVACYYLTGDFDFMLKIMTDSSDSLEEIHRALKSMVGVMSTRTHFVLKTVKNEYNAFPEEIK